MRNTDKNVHQSVIIVLRSQVGTGPTLRTAFAGQCLRVRARQQKADRTNVDVRSAIATQRLKPPRALPKQGTQKLAAKKPAPKKGGTQPLKPLVQVPSATQIKKVLVGTLATGRTSQLGMQAINLTCLHRGIALHASWHAGLLTLAEKAGLTLTFIERSGLLSKAESLGLLSLATDRCRLLPHAFGSSRIADLLHAPMR